MTSGSAEGAGASGGSTESETPDRWGAYPRLTPEQLSDLEGAGTRRVVRAGDVLVREGERDRDFLVVLAGTVRVVEGYGTPQERTIRVHGPGRFLDEIGLLTGQPAFV